MAFVQYLKFGYENLPLPDSYDLDLSDVEADSGGETEAGTKQRDVIRAGVVTISVSFSVTPAWLAKLSAYAKKSKILVAYFDTETLTTTVNEDCTVTFLFRDGTETTQTIQKGVRQYVRRSPKTNGDIPAGVNSGDTN